MFQKFRKKIYSQNGEDGIIEKILSRLDGKLDKTCCECGAWNGIHLSNCYNLDIKEIKVLPNFLLKFPDNYNFFQKIYFKLYSHTYLLFRYPEKFNEIIKKN